MTYPSVADSIVSMTDMCVTLSLVNDPYSTDHAWEGGCIIQLINAEKYLRNEHTAQQTFGYCARPPTVVS